MSEGTVTVSKNVVEAGEGVLGQCAIDFQDQANIARRRAIQRVAFGLLWLAGIAAVLVLVFVVGYVFIVGAGTVLTDFPSFLTTEPKGGLSAEGGISTTIITTFYVVLLTISIAAPLGIGAAVYLVEYAEEMQNHGGLIPRLVGVVRFGVETLAGVPSIIFGLFGYALFVSAQALGFGFSLLSGSLACACLLLPVIIRASEEALKAVPRSYRQGSLALGATHWQTVWGVVLPAALPGIITGIVLSVGRVVSETAVFYVTLGGTHNLPASVFQGGRTMAMHLYTVATETTAYEKAMATGTVLIVTIVLINLVINLISRRLTAGLKGR
jgi:phosphate transport system permease protein